MTHQLPPPKNDTEEKVEKPREILMKNLTHLLPPQKRRLTQSTKQRYHKNPQKRLLPPKIIKITQLTNQINKRSIPVTNI